MPGDFGGLVDGGFDSGAGNGVGDFQEFIFDEHQGRLPLGFAAGGGELFLDFDDGLDGLVGKFESGLEFGFGKLLATAFDH